LLIDIEDETIVKGVAEYKRVTEGGVDVTVGNFVVVLVVGLGRFVVVVVSISVISFFLKVWSIRWSLEVCMMGSAKPASFVVVGTKSTGIRTGLIWEWEEMGAEVCCFI